MSDVEELGAIADALSDMAGAITPHGASPVRGSSGEGYVASLTEAVMDVASSLRRIAEAIESKA